MVSIGHKIIGVVAGVVTLFLIAMGAFYIKHQEDAILKQNESTMLKLTESVSQGLKALMLAGYADIARNFADRLEGIEGVEDFRIMRTNGDQAFMDNLTIDAVNKQRGEEEFLRRENEQTVSVLPSDHVDIGKVLKTENVEFYYEEVTGERFLTFLAPIVAQDECYDCHDEATPVRGILKLTTSLAAVQEDIDETWMLSIVVFAIAIIGIIFLTNLIISKTVINPIGVVTHAMQRATDGDLTSHVPVLGRDELSQMAASFNMMTEELERTYSGLVSEQNKLATIILSAQEGIVVTDGDGKVVLVNPAAEYLLGKSTEIITSEGFMQILDDPTGLNDLLTREQAVKQPETVEYGDFVLSVYADTIKSPDGKLVGSAALLRDITEEKRLEERLRRLSTTDGLTGLYNRRFLDQNLTAELLRSKRYKNNLAIFLFDVDHFKSFNDTYGHDEGDRVLKAISEIFQHNMRNVDKPCRYGGEEFLAIMPDTDLQGALVVAERTRREIEQSDVNGLKVTISVGIAAYPEIIPASPEEFIQAADKALYVAKNAGRNRIKLADRLDKA